MKKAVAKTECRSKTTREVGYSRGRYKIKLFMNEKQSDWYNLLLIIL